MKLWAHFLGKSFEVPSRTLLSFFVANRPSITLHHHDIILLIEGICSVQVEVDLKIVGTPSSSLYLTHRPVNEIRRDTFEACESIVLCASQIQARCLIEDTIIKNFINFKLS